MNTRAHVSVGISSIPRVTCGLLFLFIAITPVFAHAAQPAPPPPQAAVSKEAPSTPTLIGASEIIPEAEQTIRQLQEIRVQLDADVVLSSIETASPAFTEKLDRWWESEARAATESRSVQRLSDVSWEWRVQREQTYSWNTSLSARSQELSGASEEVDRIVATWKETQTASQKKSIPKAALLKVAEVLREAELTRRAIQAQTAQLVTLQSQIADKVTALEEIRKRIDEARKHTGEGLFTLDSPPIWQVLFAAATPESIAAQTTASATKVFHDMRDFLQRYRNRLILHFVLFLAMLVSFYLLHRSYREVTAKGTLGISALHVLDRFVSSSLLLAFLVIPLLYPGAAINIIRAAVLPTVIPAMRLVPEWLPKIFRRGIYFLLGLYVLDFLRYYLPADWLLVRILLTLIGALGLIGLSLVLSSAKQQRSSLGYGERAAVVVARCVFLLFAVSLIAGIIGNVSLAEILVSAPIRIAYAGMLLLAGKQVVMTFSLLALRSPLLQVFCSVRENYDAIALQLNKLLGWAAIFSWTFLSLQIVGKLDAAWERTANFLSLKWQVGAAEVSAHNLVIFVLVLLIAYAFSRLLGFILTEEIFPRIRLSRGVPDAIELLSRYTILLVGFLLALSAAGVNLSQVTLALSALGVGIGFGLQNVVNNFVSGLILVFEHPVQVGDYVEVGSTTGVVRKIGFRASLIHTLDGADIIIPNGELIGSKVINWSLSDRLRRVKIAVEVALGSDPDRVIEILTKTARNHSEVLSEPGPSAVFDEFGEGSLKFTLRCWAPVEKFGAVRSALSIAVNNALNAAGISIPDPKRDIHVYLADEMKKAAAAEPKK